MPAGSDKPAPTPAGVLALIPARGGSKGVPRKNLRDLAGRPLIAHSIGHALGSSGVTRTMVSTDDTQIATVAQRAGAEVIDRPPEISGDTASSESALLHALDHLRDTEHYEPELVVFLQATSPIRAPDDIDRALSVFREKSADSLVSVCEAHEFLWTTQGGAARAINYDPARRPRRQDMAAQYRENGSIYIFRPRILRQTGSRLGGVIALYVMDPMSSFEIDSPEDFALVEHLAITGRRRTARGRLAEAGLVVFDFDGVFTDNRVLVMQDGTEGVLCSRGDGLGLEMLRGAGVPTVVLSKEKNPVVSARCRKLKIECVQGIDDKRPELERLARERGVDRSRVVYVGNDVNDLECMNWAGLPVAPADAHPLALNAAEIVLAGRGGLGAIRELCEMLLETRPGAGVTR